MKIGEIATRTGVPASTLRYYESLGLLPMPRRVSGRRQYDDDVFQSVALIQLAQQAGFKLNEIRFLLQPTGDHAILAAGWQQLAPQKIIELDALIARTQAMKARLQEGLACQCQQMDDCELIMEKVDSY